MRIRLNSTVQKLLETVQPRFPEASDTNDLLIQALTVLLYQCNPTQQTTSALPVPASFVQNSDSDAPAPKDAALSLFD